MMVTKASAAGACSNSGESRATMKTPAVTMVAAWISAETGVGPSIASGSQVCSRNCADLPIAPMKSSRQVIVIASTSRPKTWIVLWARPGAAAKIGSKVTEFVSTKTRKMPSVKPKSPTRLTTKALIAAALAEGFSIPEADQQIGGEADALPAEEHLHEIVGRHQHQHGEGEERQIGEEARPRRILGHIADRIEMDERRDRRHDDEHDGGQRIDAQRPIDVQRARVEPACREARSNVGLWPEQKPDESRPRTAPPRRTAGSS